MLKIEKQDPHLVITIPTNWSNKTIDDLLRNVLFVPKKTLHDWRMRRIVQLNHQPIPLETLVKEGDVLSLPIYEAEENDIPAFDINLTIAYEDDDILIVEKPIGMNTHPDSPIQKNTLLNAVSSYFMKQQIHAKPRHIHRLDHDTSGLVLFAKNSYIGSLLDRQLEQRKIKRHYLALVEGFPKKESGTIQEKIGRDRHANRMRVSSTGQNAITHYKVVKTFPDKNQSLIECHLETGRTHQIRVHLSHIGHPLVGDILYNEKFARTSKSKKASKKSTQSLHAYRMVLNHPLTGLKMDVTSSSSLG